MIPRRLARAVKEAGMAGNPGIFRKIFYTAFWFWFELKYDLMEAFLIKTAVWRVKHSKKIVVTTPHLNDERTLTLEDIELNDAWGFWLPYGFMIMAQPAFDEENKFNEEHGFSLLGWEDFRDGGYPSYMLRVNELTPLVIANTAKVHMKHLLGDLCYEKDFEVRLRHTSDHWLDEENKRIAEWQAAGCPPYKVVWTEGAKEDMREIAGDDAEKLWEEKLWEDNENDG